VAHFATAKLKLKLHFIAFIQELLRVPDLNSVVVWIDIDPELDLFELGRGRSAILFLFGEVVTLFSKVHDLADRGIRRRSNLD